MFAAQPSTSSCCSSAAQPNEPVGPISRRPRVLLAAAADRWTFGWPPCSPFVSLSALSALVLLLMPSQLLLPSSSQAADSAALLSPPHQGEQLDTLWTILVPDERLFSCGGGPLSAMAASVASWPCDREQIHLCCEEHDLCYEQRHLNQTHCDDRFCDCLDRVQSGTFCDHLAQPGLCLATRMFGHLFHWTANCSAAANSAEGESVPEGCPPPLAVGNNGIQQLVDGRAVAVADVPGK